MELPDKFRFIDSVRSLRAIGKVGLATLLNRIDTHFADRINEPIDRLELGPAEAPVATEQELGGIDG